ncbi:hypothetical protein C8Q80DRAFT_1123682 [Daedaleopsis nitida]|nr:hypothetical protein C8Q80DRAFT_1123682 [Daedaleopsis nitida]
MAATSAAKAEIIPGRDIFGAGPRVSEDARSQRSVDPNRPDYRDPLVIEERFSEVDQEIQRVAINIGRDLTVAGERFDVQLKRLEDMTPANFKLLTEKVDRMELRMQDGFKRTDERHEKFEKSVNERFDKLEKKVDENFEHLKRMLDLITERLPTPLIVQPKSESPLGFAPLTNEGMDIVEAGPSSLRPRYTGIRTQVVTQDSLSDTPPRSPTSPTSPTSDDATARLDEIHELASSEPKSESALKAALQRIKRIASASSLKRKKSKERQTKE